MVWPNLLAPKHPRTNDTIQTAAPTLPPTLTAALPVDAAPASMLRFASSDCWYHVVACDSKVAPVGVAHEDLLSSDAQHQASKKFNQVRQPLGSPRLRCILCL